MGPQAAQAAKITSEMTLSEKADAIEEHMMHELDKIVTKSVFANMTDGHVDMEGGAALMKKYPGKYFNMGPDPRLPPMPEKPTLAGLLQEPARFDQSSAAKRGAGAQKRPQREGRAGVPACTTSPWWDSSAATTATGARR